MIDIVDIKTAVRKKELHFFIQNGFIYVRNDIGECVIVGELKMDKATVKEGD